MAKIHIGGKIKPKKLTKFDVAQRQINTAIRLLFDEGDSVSIHTLAIASFRILYDLSKIRSLKFHHHFDDLIVPGKEKTAHGTILWVANTA